MEFTLDHHNNIIIDMLGVLPSLLSAVELVGGWVTYTNLSCLMHSKSALQRTLILLIDRLICGHGRL